MTANELYTSLLNLYKNMMFPKNPYSQKWALAEIDQLDVHFFDELMNFDSENMQQQGKEVYLSDIW